MKPTGAGSIEIAPTNLGTINNMSIGQTTAAAGSFTNLGVSGTISLAGSTGTAGYVLTSNGASAPTWQVNSNGVTITDDTTTNATRYITFSELTTGTETTLDVSSTKLQFNPSSGQLSSPIIASPLLSITGSSSGYVRFQGAAAAGSTTYTLPSTDGTTGQVLQTNGSGTLSWTTPTGGITTGKSIAMAMIFGF
jgi:hypothetical protein